MTRFPGLKGPILAAVVLAVVLPATARADYHMRSPDEIDYLEWEFEHNGAASFDRNPDKSGEMSETVEIGRGVTEWWHPEIEIGFGRDSGPDQRQRVQAVVWENIVRLTEPGENWADLGLYAEYAHATQAGVADSTAVGPLVQKDVGRTTHTFNLLFNKTIGSDQDNHAWDTSYAWQSRWNIWRAASPAIEIYGDAGKPDPFTHLETQQILAGPILVGNTRLSGYGRLKYEVGPLFGLTSASPATTLRWRLEWEVRF